MLDPQKVDLRKQPSLASIFSSVGRRFDMVFERFFDPKTHATSKDAFSAKTSKLLISTGKINIFKVSRLQVLKEYITRGFKNHMFLTILIFYILYIFAFSFLFLGSAA